ncbi:MAG: hypothetical protein ACPGEF_05240 [Endozoicomonas sp.]
MNSANTLYQTAMKKHSEDGVRKLFEKYRDQLIACSKIEEFTKDEKEQNYERTCNLSCRMAAFSNKITNSSEKRYHNGYKHIANAIDAMAEFQRMRFQPDPDFDVSYVAVNTLSKQLRVEDKEYFQEHCLGMKSESPKPLESAVITLTEKLNKYSEKIDKLKKKLQLVTDENSNHEIIEDIN